MSIERSDLFDFMLQRVRAVREDFGDPLPQAFGRWFAQLYFNDPQEIFISDGAKDGKIDLFFKTHNDEAVRHHVVNTKFTSTYNKLAPPEFYSEVAIFSQAFTFRENRGQYLEKAVKKELRSRYQTLFEQHDKGNAELMFVTNCRRNDAYAGQVKKLPVKIFHLDDLVQCLVDDIDGAMPRTPEIHLESIQAVLSPDRADTEVATSIVFARLVDFIRYMKDDKFDLLFMRNVRIPISIGKSAVNRGIRQTFETSPREFAFSNNGITMLCEKQKWDPGSKTLSLENPRVVNGSQTLHSIRDVANPSTNARVMVRVIEIEPPSGSKVGDGAKRRKEVISKIAVRSNQQNPIKKWDLVSNDDFQLELFRFFRTKGYFYERRDKEWRQRSRELKSVGIQESIGIKRLSQLIAAFNWQHNQLGAAVAKQQVGLLFGDDLYPLIRKTEPELAFQLHLLNENVVECTRELLGERQYIKQLKPHAQFVIFAMTVKALTVAGIAWGTQQTTEMLQAQWGEWDEHCDDWKNLVRKCFSVLKNGVSEVAAAHAGEDGVDLTYANLFKSQRYVNALLSPSIPKELKILASSCIT